MNKDNFKKVLDQIEQHPETWDQDIWHSPCGTQHCFAGWAEILAGHEQSLDHFTVQKHAIDYLAIHLDEADWLFDADRTLADFRDVLENGFPADLYP